MENKKNGKGLIVLVVILSILLVGTISHICYNKYFSNEENNKIEEITKKQKLKEEKMKLALKLHESLIDGYDAYGLHFENQTIETVSFDEILPYVIYNYFKDKKLELSHNYDGGYFNKNYKNKNEIVITQNSDPEDPEYVIDPLTVSKKEIDKYFKEKFNTKRVLDIKGNKYCSNNGKCFFSDGIASPDSACIAFLYDIKSQKFYFGCYSWSVKTTSKFLKNETDGHNMYIYDKIIARARYNGGGYEYFTNTRWEKSLFQEGRYAYNDEWHVSSHTIKDFNVKEEELNEDYIFENYSDYLDTYKHTFKKADNGKYYWYSSEIVK